MSRAGAALALCLALALPATAGAKCAPLDREEALRVSDVVFEGVVGGHVGDEAAATVAPEKSEVVEVSRHNRFRVARYLRGGGADHVQVKRLILPGAFPATQPRPGEVWRVYARRGSDGDLVFAVCVPYSTRLDGDAEARVRGLLAADAGADEADSGDDEGGGVSTWLLVVAGAAAIAALVGVVRIARARR